MRSRRVRLGLLVATTFVVAACGSTTPQSGPTPAGPAEVGPAPASREPAPATSGPQAGAVPGPPAAAVAAVPDGRRPARIAIPIIGVDASVTELGIAADGVIEVPSVAAEAGWLDTTPAPGEQGPSVVAGHVDSKTGPAVFYRLSSLTPGAKIVITSQNGSTARFTVDGVRTYAKDDFPTADVYGPVPGPALRLITCGGDFDESVGHYEDNVVVYAS